ncbi:MAG: N-acetylmuramoyl-L-alanine amidase [Phycisphaerales bacterium]|nr:N-acetylmuramoyl-L-alanine amidase [Phycisphaerales bacterium]
MADSRSSRGEVSRRQALRTGAGLGALLLASGTLSGLGGCASASERRKRQLGAKLGDPIASDPVLKTARPAPIYTPSTSGGGSMGSVAESSLERIPSFVIPRSKWTTGEPRLWLADPMGSVRRITVHHDAISPAPSGAYGDSVRRLTAIRKGHLGNGWADIGYHYAIDPSGRVWEARPLVLQGAHVKDQNPNNIGVVMFGNYENIRPTASAMESLNRLLAHEMARFNIPIRNVYTHRELASTACPGRHLQEQMMGTRGRGGALALLASSMGVHS